jgi:hypothetical protein
MKPKTPPMRKAGRKRDFMGSAISGGASMGELVGTLIEAEYYPRSRVLTETPPSHLPRRRSPRVSCIELRERNVGRHL